MKNDEAIAAVNRALRVLGVLPAEGHPPDAATTAEGAVVRVVLPMRGDEHYTLDITFDAIEAGVTTYLVKGALAEIARLEAPPPPSVAEQARERYFLAIEEVIALIEHEADANQAVTDAVRALAQKHRNQLVLALDAAPWGASVSPEHWARSLKASLDVQDAVQDRDRLSRLRVDAQDRASRELQAWAAAAADEP